MWHAEVRIDLDAIRDNVATLCASTRAEVMAVVKADGYGHGMLPSARAALAGGATWLGVCTLGEALDLRRDGITAPVLAWLLAPGLPLHEAVAADIDLSAASVGLLEEIAAGGAPPRGAARGAPEGSTRPGPRRRRPDRMAPALRGRRQGGGRG